jgi:two-component system, chemotaxis family, protein-glutamate methylesterase/glutaminase
VTIAGPRGREEADGAAGRRLHVMVVDDSAVAREVMSRVLAREFTVTTASDPIIAMDKIGHARPDVILLDLEMPRMHGLTFLRLIRQESNLPVVVCSSLAGRGTDMALRALEQGAVDVVAKPQMGVREFLLDAEILLVETIRGAAQARGRETRIAGKTLTFPVFPPPPVPERQRMAPAARPAVDSLIALGASTGGTEALRLILERLPPDAPPVVVVQHMPEHFTAAFARRLDECCQISVKEAAQGDDLRPGRVLIAAGNRHLVVRRQGRHYFVELSDGPLVSRHRPSVDVLFRSVGALLTGMGDDGADGLLEMKRAGARTIAQDEATSVVFGMPKEAIARKAADQVAPLGRIPYLLLAGAGAPSHSPA